MLFNTPRVSHFARNGQKQDEVFQHGELGTFHEEPWRCAHGERLSWAPPGVGAVPCLPPREQKPRCFSCWTLFLQRIRFIWEGRGGGKNPARSVCLARNHLLILRWGGWRAVQRLPRALQHGEAGALCHVLHFGLQLGSAENTACGGRDGGNGARRRSSATAPAAGGAEGKGQGRSWCQGLAVSRGLSTSTGERVWSSLSSMCW